MPFALATAFQRICHLMASGCWLRREVRQHWFILPTGTGSPRTLPPGPLVERFEANFLPDGRRIVFGGREKDHGRRIYVQDVQSGLVRAISPENYGNQRSCNAGWSVRDRRYSGKALPFSR